MKWYLPMLEISALLVCAVLIGCSQDETKSKSSIESIEVIELNDQNQMIETVQSTELAETKTFLLNVDTSLKIGDGAIIGRLNQNYLTPIFVHNLGIQPFKNKNEILVRFDLEGLQEVNGADLALLLITDSDTINLSANTIQE